MGVNEAVKVVGLSHFEKDVNSLLSGVVAKELPAGTPDFALFKIILREHF